MINVKVIIISRYFIKSNIVSGNIHKRKMRNPKEHIFLEEFLRSHHSLRNRCVPRSDKEIASLKQMQFSGKVLVK